MNGPPPDFWVMLSAFAIILVHTIFPAIRKLGGTGARILNSMSSGFGLTHWLLFNTDALYQYADSLHKTTYQNIPAEFLLYIFLCFVMVGVLIMHGIRSTTRFLRKNNVVVPDLIYRLKLFILFLFNYSACHYIPISAHKETAEVAIYTLDCMIAYSLADYSLTETFPEQYNFAGRLFAICGVMLGILTGYFSPHQEHDWFMAYLDSFLMGCEMILIMTVEFAQDDTAKHYWTFFFSVIFMTILLGSFYYVNWAYLL